MNDKTLKSLIDSMPQPFKKGLWHWFADYLACLKYGNVRDAAKIRENIINDLRGRL